VRGGAAGIAADQRQPGQADPGQHRVNRDRRGHLPFGVNPALHGGLGADLNGGAEQADTEDPPADGRRA
jgi:hypothetical protein